MSIEKSIAFSKDNKLEDYVSDYYKLDFESKFDLIDTLCLIAEDIKKLFIAYKIDPVFYTEKIFGFLDFSKKFKVDKEYEMYLNDFLGWGFASYKFYIDYIFDNFYTNIDKSIFLKPFDSLFKLFLYGRLSEINDKLRDYELLKEIPNDPMEKITVAYDIIGNRLCLHTMDYNKGFQTHPSVLNSSEHYYVQIGFVSPKQFFKDTLRGINFSMNFNSICNCIQKIVMLSKDMDLPLKYLYCTKENLENIKGLSNKEESLLKSIVENRLMCLYIDDYYMLNPYEEFMKSLVEFLQIQLGKLNKHDLTKSELIDYLKYFINYAVY